MTTLVDTLVPDDLWVIVQPLLPPPPRPWWGGRRRTIPDRNCFAANRVHGPHVHPLAPAPSPGAGLRLTRHRLAAADQWTTARVFERFHLEILDRLGVAGRLDWSRASVDSMTVRTKRGTTLAQIRSIAASQGPSSTWSARGAGCH
jgi:hypothetical protein